MSTSEPDSPELVPADIALAMAWIDGELEPEAAQDFELRLAADPALAARVESLSLLDEHLRRDARVRARTERTRQRWNVGVGLAAAALLLITVVPQLFAPRAPDFEVALAPGFAMAEEWIGTQPELRGASAPGIATSRGAGGAPRSAEEFLRASELAEVQVSEQALAQGRRELQAGWFVLPMRLEEQASVLVFGFSESAPATRLFPASTDAASASVASRVMAGRRILPGPRAVAGEKARTVQYQPGFLLPLGVGELQVLIAVRRDELDSTWLRELDGELAAGTSAQQLAARLEREGFRLQRLVVREPK